MRAFLPLLTLFVIRLAPGIAFQSVAVAAPLLMLALGLNHAQAGLALGVFTLPGLVVSVPAGMLARRIGDSAVLCGALLLVAAGALIAGTAHAYPLLLAGRALGGAGGVSILMLVLKMTADRYAGPWLATASAVTITAWPAGLALGLLVFGPLPQALGWRATLLLAGAPALLGLLLVPLIGRAKGGTAAAAHAAGIAPLPPRRFMLGAIATWAMINAVLPIIIGFLPGYLMSQGRDLDAAAAATSLAVWTPAIGIPLGGLLADRLLGRRAAVMLGLTLTAAMLLLIGSGITMGMALAAFGIAFSLAPGPLTAQLGQAMPLRARAVVFGWYSACSYGAMTVGPWVAGWLRDSTGDPRAPLLFAAAVMLLALAPYALMDRAAAALPAVVAPEAG
ncbi:MAG TPA: MFS transporter [Acetobacteraceae bacterium]|nr:MFS transporter [Acetobacteraceae bacterium]